MPMMMLAIEHPLVFLITVFGTFGVALLWAYGQTRDLGDRR